MSGALSSSLMCFGEDTKTIRASGANISKGVPSDYPNDGESTCISTGTLWMSYLVESVKNNTRAVQKVGPSLNSSFQESDKTAKSHLRVEDDEYIDFADMVY